MKMTSPYILGICFCFVFGWVFFWICLGFFRCVNDVLDVFWDLGDFVGCFKGCLCLLGIFKLLGIFRELYDSWSHPPLI